MSELTCKQRINGELKERIKELTILWNAYTDRNGQARTEDGNVIGGDMGGAHIYEFGLSFNYTQPEGRKRGYFRYQLSWGGPSDEFRFYASGSGYKWRVDRVEYVFMNWWDGSKRTLSGKRLDLLEDIFENLFVQSAQAEFDKSQEN
jgi:hypothetical protein